MEPLSQRLSQDELTALFVEVERPLATVLSRMERAETTSWPTPDQSGVPCGPSAASRSVWER